MAQKIANGNLLYGSGNSNGLYINLEGWDGQKMGGRFIREGIYVYVWLILIECLMNYGLRFVTLYRRQGSRPSPWKRNAKKAKRLSEEALQIAVKRREAKSKGEKERYKLPKNSKKR